MLVAGDVYGLSVNMPDLIWMVLLRMMSHGSGAVQQRYATLTALVPHPSTLTSHPSCGSGTLDVKEFSARFDSNSAAGDSKDTLGKRAAVLATAALREGLQTPEELFSKFAGWSDLMSRKVRCA